MLDFLPGVGTKAVHFWCQGFQCQGLASVEGDLASIKVTSAGSAGAFFGFFLVLDLYIQCMLKKVLADTSLSGLALVVTISCGSKMTHMDCSNRCSLSGVKKDLYIEYLSGL